MSNVWFILCCRITDEVVVACKLLNGHLYKGKEIGREQMVIMHLKDEAEAGGGGGQITSILITFA